MSVSTHKSRTIRIIEPIANLSAYINEAQRIYDLENKIIRIPKRENFFLTANTENINSFNSKTLSQEKIPKINSRLYNPIKTEENFNVTKKVKEIKELAEKSLKTYDPFMRNKTRVAFDSRNADIIFEARKQINNFEKRQANKLLDKIGSLQKFYRENKQIAINNVLIKLLNNESKKLEDLEKEKTKNIKEGKATEIINDKYFEDYSILQKYTVKEIDKIISLIQDKYRHLLIQARIIENNNRIINDEMFKELNRIEDLRIYAQFTNEVFKLPQKFNKKIIKNSEFTVTDHRNISVEDLVKKTFKHYSFLLNSNYLEEEKNVNEIIQDPNTLIDQFHVIENDIIKLVSFGENIYNESIIMKEEHINSVNELKSKLEIYEKEYKIEKEKYKKSLEEYTKIVSLKSKDKNHFAVDLINELYEFLFINHEKDPFHILGTRMTFNKPKKIPIEIMLKDLISKVQSEERKVNNLIMNLDNYEMKDPDTFIPIINDYKSELKLTKQLQAKYKIEEELNTKKILFKKKFDKVIIQSRKTAAPFRIAKKRKKIELDPEKEKEIEEMNLLFY